MKGLIYMEDTILMLLTLHIFTVKNVNYME